MNNKLQTTMTPKKGQGDYSIRNLRFSHSSLGIPNQEVSQRSSSSKRDYQVLRDIIDKVEKIMKDYNETLEDACPFGIGAGNPGESKGDTRCFSSVQRPESKQ
jgi:hypothetical protein